MLGFYKRLACWAERLACSAFIKDWHAGLRDWHVGLKAEGIQKHQRGQKQGMVFTRRARTDLGQHDEARAVLVEHRIHGAGGQDERVGTGSETTDRLLTQWGSNIIRNLLN
jgi:hypothetical protein